MTGKPEPAGSEAPILRQAIERRWLIIASVVVFTILGAALSFLQSPRYESSATLVIQEPGSVGFLGADGSFRADRYVADQVAILSSDSVAGRAIEILESDFTDLPTLKAFRQSRTVNSSSDSDVIEVVFAADDPQLSQSGANALVAAYREAVRTEATQIFDETLTTLDATIFETNGEVADLESDIVEASARVPEDIDIEYEGAQARLVQLQRSRSNIDVEELDGFRAELTDLLTFLEAVRVVRSLDVEPPELSSLLTELASVLERRDELVSLRNAVALDAKFAGRSAIIFSVAGPGEEVSGSFVQILVIAAVLGALFGLGLLLVIPAAKPMIETPEDAADVLGTTVLADIPDFTSLTEPFLAVAAPGSDAAARFARATTTLQTRLDIVRHGLGESSAASAMALERDEKGRFKKPPRSDSFFGSGRSVVVVSAGPAEGRTAMVANLAAAAATQSSRILAVDAHFEHQGLTKMLEGATSMGLGLTDIVQRGVALSDAVRTVDLGSGSQLNLISRGTSAGAPLDFFRSGKAREFFRDAADEYDLVFVDTPPLYVAPYAAALARYCDEVAVVIPHGSPLAEVAALADQLHIVSANLLGIIYNRHLPGTVDDS